MTRASLVTIATTKWHDAAFAPAALVSPGNKPLLAVSIP